MVLLPIPVHPKGELSNAHEEQNLSTENVRFPVDTFGGRVHVEWNPQAAVTPLGQLPFFIEFLKLGGVFDAWVEECPLALHSPNAPSNRDILGTLLLSVLAGHTRYAHITALRCDGVNPDLFGIRRVISEDSMRRAFLRIEETPGVDWLKKHLKTCYFPLLSVPWVLDVDTTIKVLYGKQEGAVVGYNPKKPGRPSHVYHTYSIANLRLVLEVEVQPGNQTAASYSAPDLWSLLDGLPRDRWPEFIRGDCAFGTDAVMRAAEERNLPYLFKLKLTKNVQRTIERLATTSGWTSAGQGWEGQQPTLQWWGWEKSRRVVVLRKPILQELPVVANNTGSGQLEMSFGEVNQQTVVYEHAVLVTTLPDEIITISQHYRDRADSENVFDELKNQWGWGGFTTHDLKRCRLMARVVALVYNWWNLFVRLAEPDKHMEAITSRPLLMHAIGKQILHAGQTIITISSLHGKFKKAQEMLRRVSAFFKTLKSLAEQLTAEQRWYRILSKAVEKYLNGRQLQLPIVLPTPA